MAEVGSRSVYLVTYSQADRQKCESAEKFAEIITAAFENCKVLQWASSEESHSEGGFHYHLALKFDRVKRWKKVRDFIQQRYDICVNFSNSHENYYSAYTYVIKEGSYVLSQNHPVYTGSPKTGKASRKRKEGRSESDESSASCSRSRRSITVLDVHEMIVKQNVKTDDELCRQASREKADGKVDLAEFILKKPENRRRELIKTAWKIENAEKACDRKGMSIIDIFEATGQLECSCPEYCKWYEMAGQVLYNNDIDITKFAAGIYNALSQGRRKFANFMITGPTNCGKTFLLMPLTKIFNTFLNPASGTFAWVGAVTSEVVFLNDFRWSEKILPWHDFLNLLEGAPIHISAPKTHYAEDLLWDKKQPVFSTASHEIIKKFISGDIDERETEMMKTRWNVFKLKYRIDEKDAVIIEPCAKCFHSLIDNFRRL
eukprot:TCONS_00055769-protein